tara:strand:- start:224 stop:532 length:309 start_codon:yes stop_codon:yes gene_type:complete
VELLLLLREAVASLVVALPLEVKLEPPSEEVGLAYRPSLAAEASSPFQVVMALHLALEGEALLLQEAVVSPFQEEGALLLEVMELIPYQAEALLVTQAVVES